MAERMLHPMDLVNVLPLESGQRWGEVAQSWQRQDAEAILDRDGPALHFLTRPRGASKTVDLAAVALALLLFQQPAGARSYAVAADADQAALLTDAIRGFVARTPQLTDHVDVLARRVVRRSNGATLDVIPADASSAYGLRPFFVVADELSSWPATPNARGVWTAVVSAIPKLPDARLVVLTTSGDPSHWSFKVLQHARTSPAWRVREIAGPTPWINPEALEEQKALLTESQYRRLHLNEWCASEDAFVTDADVLRRCVSHPGILAPVPGVRYVIGCDLGWRNDRTAIVVGHAELVEPTVRRVVVDRVVVYDPARLGAEVPLDDVEATLIDLARTYNGARVWLDPREAVLLRQRLIRRGIDAHEQTFTQDSNERRATVLYLLIRDGLIGLPDDAELLDEFLRVRLVTTSLGRLRIDHQTGEHDDRVVAVGMAAVALTAESLPTRASSIVPGGRTDNQPLRAAFADGRAGMSLRPAGYDEHGRWIPPLPAHLQPQRRRRRARIITPNRRPKP